MKYDVDQGIDDHWYPVAAPLDSESAAKAVAKTARSEGLYRARPAGHPGSRYELFRVPAWGQPISLGTL
jgi:hypothetical protein